MDLDQCRRREVSHTPPKDSAMLSSEHDVHTVREMLNEVAFSPLPASDTWDAAAVEQMRKFQRSEGLPATGYPDDQTVARLSKRIECAETLRADAANQPEAATTLSTADLQIDNPLQNTTVNHVTHLGHQVIESAENFAHRFAKDGALREGYMKEVRAGVDAILDRMKSGKITPGQAAYEASKLRNALLDATRSELSPAALALSKHMKEEGLGFGEILAKYSQKLYGKAPRALTPAEGERVLLVIGERAGVTSAWVNRLGTTAAHAGPYLKALGFAMAFVQVATAEDRVRETVKVGAGFAGFEAGAWLGAAASPVCGPAAPACLVVLPLVFGIAGAVAADKAADVAYEHVIKG